MSTANRVRLARAGAWGALLVCVLAGWLFVDAAEGRTQLLLLGLLLFSTGTLLTPMALAGASDPLVETTSQVQAIIGGLGMVGVAAFAPLGGISDRLMFGLFGAALVGITGWTWMQRRNA